MTRKKYIKMVIAMSEKMYVSQGKHLNGEVLKWFRDFNIAKISRFNSYNDAWENLKVLRNCVKM